MNSRATSQGTARFPSIAVLPALVSDSTSSHRFNCHSESPGVVIGIPSRATPICPPAPGVAPWNNIQAMYMGARVTADLDDHWRITTGASILFAGEPGVDVSEAATIQGIISATWALDKTFFIGGGVLLSSQLEDSILAIPLILIYWEFADDFVLSNILGPETYPTGAGLEVAWRPNRGTELSIGGRYENRRFRLDDSGPANRANGVGQDTGFPIWARATWKFRGGFRIDLVGGVSLFNSYELDDSVGEEIGSADLDPTPFLGLFASYRF